jgi:hypothetical protein
MGQIREFQKESGQWVIDKFGDKIHACLEERGIRVLEEATEFAQSVGVSSEKMLNIIAQVMRKPPGEPIQELAGTLHTVLSAAESLNQDLETHFIEETRRINALPPEYFKDRHSRKVKAEGL